MSSGQNSGDMFSSLSKASKLDFFNQNQGYAQNDVQLAAGNQRTWQEQQGFNNIGYQNDSNQGHALNNVQFVENHGYQTTQGSNNGSAQNDGQLAVGNGRTENDPSWNMIHPKKGKCSIQI